MDSHMLIMHVSGLAISDRQSLRVYWVSYIIHRCHFHGMAICSHSIVIIIMIIYMRMSMDAARATDKYIFGGHNTMSLNPRRLAVLL